MDPIANLREQVTRAKTIQALWDVEIDPPDLEAMAHEAARLSELVLALDEWRKKGGFDPYVKGGK